MDVTVIAEGGELNVDRTATGAVALCHHNGKTTVFLVKSLKSKYFVLPKGGLEDGLTPAENAIKETQEEGGIEVSIVRLISDDILSYPAQYGFESKIQREIYYLAKFEGIDLDGSEDREVGWFDVEEARKIMPEYQFSVVEKAVDQLDAALIAELLPAYLR